MGPLSVSGGNVTYLLGQYSARGQRFVIFDLMLSDYFETVISFENDVAIFSTIKKNVKICEKLDYIYSIYYILTYYSCLSSGTRFMYNKLT